MPTLRANLFMGLILPVAALSVLKGVQSMAGKFAASNKSKKVRVGFKTDHETAAFAPRIVPVRDPS